MRLTQDLTDLMLMDSRKKGDNSRAQLGRTLSLRQRTTRVIWRTSTGQRQTFLTPLPEQTLTRRLEATTALQVNLSISWETRSILTAALLSHPIFCVLPKAEIFHLISKLKYYEIGPNEVIYEQGFPPTNFYILRDGKAVMRSNGRNVRHLKAGSSFGHTALFHSNPRNHTVATLECSSFFSLDQDDFHLFLKVAQIHNYETLRNLNYTFKQLEGLPSHYIDALSKFSVMERYFPGESVVVEGESGSVLYFILKGDAVVTANDEEIRRLYPGDCFGEQALLYDGIRTATVAAVSELTVEAVPKQVLYRLFGSNLDDFIYTNTARIALDKVPALQCLGSAEKERLIECMSIFTFGYDEVVILEGTELRSAMYIVLNGTLCTRKSIRELDLVASVYDCLCVEEVMNGSSDSVFDADVVSDTDEVAVGIISKEELNACLGVSSSISKAISTRQFKGIPVLEELPREKQQALVKLLKITEYPDTAPICLQDTPGSIFYILKSGIVTIHQNGHPVRSITRSDYFGEKAVLTGQPRTASVYAKGKCVVWELSNEHFHQFFDRKVQEMMINRIERADVTVGLEDLVPVMKLGRGQFGCVLLVADRNGEIFALKAISRRKVSSMNQAKYLLMERSVLMQISHRFIMKLIKTFKDETYLYFLLEYIPGATLFDVFHEIGRFSLPDATFYFAMIVVILEYLHERDIVHRDLKPENMMVTQNGYLKLIDFGTAKVVYGRTYTRLGTAWYMAPEVIKDKGYGAPSDIWSAGVILYELVSGRVPFGEEEDDPYVVLRLVLEKEVVYPELFNMVPECKALLTQLLQKNPSDRLSLHDLKRHKLFRNFDWNALMCGYLQPPYRPPVPNYTEMVQAAFQKKMKMKQVLDAEERDGEEEERVSECRRPPLAHWDDEF